MKQTNNYQVILTIVIGLLTLSLLFGWPTLTKVSLGIGLIAIFSKWFTDKLAYVWGKIGHILGLVNGSILLSIIFFVILTPIAFFMKIFAKKDSLMLKRPDNSAYITRNKWFEPQDLENVW
jgi:ABC-type phosphate transport system permease subunit